MVPEMLAPLAVRFPLASTLKLLPRLSPLVPKYSPPDAPHVLWVR